MTGITTFLNYKNSQNGENCIITMHISKTQNRDQLVYIFQLKEKILQQSTIEKLFQKLAARVSQGSPMFPSRIGSAFHCFWCFKNSREQ